MYIEYQGKFYKARGGGRLYEDLGPGRTKRRIYKFTANGIKHIVRVPVPSYDKDTYKAYDTDTKPTMSSRRRRVSRRRSVAQKRKDCKAKGKVYNPETGRCRKSRR